MHMKLDLLLYAIQYSYSFGNVEHISRSDYYIQGLYQTLTILVVNGLNVDVPAG